MLILKSTIDLCLKGVKLLLNALQTKKRQIGFYSGQGRKVFLKLLQGLSPLPVIRRTQWQLRDMNLTFTTFNPSYLYALVNASFLHFIHQTNSKIGIKNLSINEERKSYKITKYIGLQQPNFLIILKVMPLAYTTAVPVPDVT